MESNGTVCAICLDEINYENCEEPIIETICNHVFHEECFNEWAERSSSCPYCRQILTNEFDIFTYDIHFNNLSSLFNKRINMLRKRWSLTITDNNLHLQRYVKNINRYQVLKTVEIEFKKIKWFKCGDDFLMLNILKPNGKFYKKTLYFKKMSESGLFFDHLMSQLQNQVEQVN